MKKITTFSVLAALSLLAAAWEIWTILNEEDGDTFSATIRKLGTNQPFIIFMLGMLSGHLWRNQLPIFLTGVGCGTNFWPLLDGEVLVPEKEPNQ